MYFPKPLGEHFDALNRRIREKSKPTWYQKLFLIITNSIEIPNALMEHNIDATKVIYQDTNQIIKPMKSFIVTQKDVKDQITKMKTKKQGDPDGIQTYILYI